MSAESTLARFKKKSNWIIPGQEFNGVPCLLWRGTMNSNGGPLFTFTLEGRHIGTSPRQYSWFLTRGRKAERPIDMLCGDPDCCRPSHMRLREGKHS